MEATEVRGILEGIVLGATAMVLVDQVVFRTVAIVLGRIGDWWHGRFQPG
jgi:hypothetical protein